MKYIVIITLSYLTSAPPPSAATTDEYGRISNKGMFYAVMLTNTTHKTHTIEFADKKEAFDYYYKSSKEIERTKNEPLSIMSDKITAVTIDSVKTQ